MKFLTQTHVLITVLAASSLAAPVSHGFLKHVQASETQSSPPEDPPLAPTALLEDEDPGVEQMGQKILPETSAMPQTLQFMFAGLWILMLGSLPFIMPIIDQKKVSKTQIGVGASMLIVLLGGFYLFTNVILFQSVHFRRIRPLTIIECIYFMSQVITTVGYGDITPAKTRGQVFVGMYVLGALTVITMVISDITDHIVRMAQEYKDRRKLAKDAADTRVESQRTPRDLHSLICPEKPSLMPLLSSIVFFLVVDICWVVFFSTYPGEGKTVFQAVYMSVITLSTVGLGYFTPVTEGGMIFGAFVMLIGATALVSVIGNFTELMVKLNQYERFKEESKIEALDSLRALLDHAGGDGGEDVTELQFLKFSLMQMKCVKKIHLDNIHEAFERLSPKEGVVDFQTVQKSLQDAPKAPAVSLD